MSQSVYTLHILHYVFLGTGIFFLILSVILFFKFDIRKVFGYLTGISEKKALAEIERRSKGLSSELVEKHLENIQDQTIRVSNQMDITERLECAATEETMVLEEHATDETRPLYPKDVFEIEEDITLVHTTETIRGGMRK